MDEMQDFLWDEYELNCPLTTIGNALRRAKWSRVTVRAQAEERDAHLRMLWRARQCNEAWTDDRLIFLDESASNERTGDRKKGWSPVGADCTVKRSIKRSERWSILPALTNKGYLSWVVFQGSITIEMYLAFLKEQVLPHCVPGFHILVMDNATIHRNWQILEACEEAGVEIAFLPPYSPDYNPIEATFHDLKAWIRRNHRIAEEFVTFDEFLQFALEKVCKKDPRGHFKEAGYQVM